MNFVVDERERTCHASETDVQDEERLRKCKLRDRAKTAAETEVQRETEKQVC